jgi:hypothetical protein
MALPKVRSTASWRVREMLNIPEVCTPRAFSSRHLRFRDAASSCISNFWFSHPRRYDGLFKALVGLLRRPPEWYSRVSYLLIMMLFISGCATRELPYLQRLRPLPADEHTCRVAVLPFTSESDYPQSAAMVYKVLAAELNTQGNYIVTQEGDIDKLYLQLRILPGQAPTREQLQILATRLNVQLLFTGHVMEMRDHAGANGSVNPVLAMRINILDGHSADTLWSIYHRRQGMDYQKAMHFGTINSMAGLCKQISLEILNLTFNKGLSKCDVSP